MRRIDGGECDRKIAIGGKQKWHYSKVPIAIGQGVLSVLNHWIGGTDQRCEMCRGHYVFKQSHRGFYDVYKGLHPPDGSDCDWPPRLKRLVLGKGGCGEVVEGLAGKRPGLIIRSESGFKPVLMDFEGWEGER